MFYHKHPASNFRSTLHRLCLPTTIIFIPQIWTHDVTRNKTERSVSFIHHSDFNPRLTLHIIVVWIGFLLLEQLENASSHRSAARLEARSAEAAVLRGQKLILSFSTLTHELQTLIKLWAIPGRSGTAAAQDCALVLETHHRCTKAHFVPNKIIFKI